MMVDQLTYKFCQFMSMKQGSCRSFKQAKQHQNNKLKPTSDNDNEQVSHKP
jgi:hypothetical protein